MRMIASSPPLSVLEFSGALQFVGDFAKRYQVEKGVSQ
jgi:hypothetical protein